mgnify:CR=1 FL=1
MELITVRRLFEYMDDYPRAENSIKRWILLAKCAKWKNHIEMRQTFPDADPVRVNSGRTVTVFDICGNHYRMIAAIHYDRQKTYILRFLTHKEYDEGTWKKEL